MAHRCEDHASTKVSADMHKPWLDLICYLKNFVLVKKIQVFKRTKTLLAKKVLNWLKKKLSSCMDRADPFVFKYWLLIWVYQAILRIKIEKPVKGGL